MITVLNAMIIANNMPDNEPKNNYL